MPTGLQPNHYAKAVSISMIWRMGGVPRRVVFAIVLGTLLNPLN
jgi:hypothetical protein